MQQATAFLVDGTNGAVRVRSGSVGLVIFRRSLCRPFTFCLACGAPSPSSKRTRSLFSEYPFKVFAVASTQTCPQLAWQVLRLACAVVVVMVVVVVVVLSADRVDKSTRERFKKRSATILHAHTIIKTFQPLAGIDPPPAGGRVGRACRVGRGGRTSTKPKPQRGMETEAQYALYVMTV